jgi:lysophospholipase L1-like esterase
MSDTEQRGLLKVVTMGDSLTQGGVPPEHRHGNTTQYQWFMYKFLKDQGIGVDIWNLGIGGQTIGQIVNRISPALPANFVTIMGGTNDIWHFIAAMEGHEDEIIDGIIEEITRGIHMVKNNPACKNTRTIICSMPPFGEVKTLPNSAFGTLNKTNALVEQLCKKEEAIFCDVNKAMRIDDRMKFARQDLVVADGVHFTVAGNQACGEAIARCIAAAVKK